MEEAQASPEPAPAPESVSEPQVSQEEVPQNYNIFSDEPAQVADARPEEEAAPKKSKQFLEKIRNDKAARAQEIAFKQRAMQLEARERHVQGLANSREMLEKDPDQFLRSQGIDPMEYYRSWTERMINDGNVSVESQVSNTQKELEALKNQMQQKEMQEQQQRAGAQQQAAYGQLIGEVEHFATSNEGYETIKGSCTARDIVNGMITHFKATGEELTIEEAFEKIESGLRSREESFYSDPKVVEKLRRYNPEAMRTARSPQATLSARYKEQPTRTDSEDLSLDEIRKKFPLFT